MLLLPLSVLPLSMLLLVDGALVKASANLGVRLLKRRLVDGGISELEIDQPNSDTPRVYRVLGSIGFSSFRKRMDVIVQCPEDAADMCTVITKGADSVIKDSCIRNPDSEEFRSTWDLCNNHSEQVSNWRAALS